MPTLASVGRTILVSIPPVVAALWAFQHLNAAVGPFLQPIMDKCGVDTVSIENPLTKFVSFLNCFIVPFFLEIVRTKCGAFIWGNFCALGAAFGGLTAVESARLKARIPLSWQGVYTLIFMLIGVSIGMPLLWLPAYFALGMPSTFASPSDMKISWPRVLVMSFFNIIFFVNGMASVFEWASPWPPITLEVIIKGAVWIPVIAPFLWVFVPVFSSCNEEKGKSAVIFMHCFNAGICTASHFGLLLYFFANPVIFDTMVGLFSSHEGGAACNYFLMVDLFIFWAACVYHVLVEEGVLASLLVILTTPLLGLGGPLSFYYMYREYKIFSSPKKTSKKKKVN